MDYKNVDTLLDTENSQEVFFNDSVEDLLEENPKSENNDMIEDFEKLGFLFSLYPQLPQIQKDRLLSDIINNYIYDDANNTFKTYNVNPFTPEIFSMLISETPPNEMNIEKLLTIANFICEIFPNDIKMLEEFLQYLCSFLSLKIFTPLISEILDFLTNFLSLRIDLINPDIFALITEVAFLPSDLNQECVLLEAPFPNSSNAIKDGINSIIYRIMESGFKFYQSIFARIPPEIANFYFSIPNFFINVLITIAEIVSRIETYKKNKEREALSTDDEIRARTPEDQFLKVHEKNVRNTGKKFVTQALNFIQFICKLNTPAVAPHFLCKYVSMDKKLSGRKFIYYLMETRRCTIHKEINHLYLSSIIRNLLEFNFDMFFDDLDYFGLYDFCFGYLTQNLPLPQDTIQIFIVLLTKAPMNDKYEILSERFSRYFKASFDIKYPISLAFANLILKNDIGNSILTSISEKIQLFPCLLDCSSQAKNDNDSILLLKSLHKLIKFRLDTDREEFLKFLDEIGMSFDDLEFNRKNPEIEFLINTIVDLISEFQDG